MAKKATTQTNRGVKPGTVRGKYKKRTKKPRISKVIKERTVEELPALFEELKPRSKPSTPSIIEYDEEGNRIYKGSESTQFKKGHVNNHKPTGRPKGVRNRSTIVREILQAVKWGKDPLTGKEDFIPMEYQMTLAILQKAMKGDVTAYNALMNNSYKPHAQEVENKNANIDLSQFTPDQLKGFLNDGDDE